MPSFCVNDVSLLTEARPAAGENGECIQGHILEGPPDAAC
jgi:hypothetical protein